MPPGVSLADARISELELKMSGLAGEIEGMRVAVYSQGGAGSPMPR